MNYGNYISSKNFVLGIILFVSVFPIVISQPSHAHCQIPCGIYDDYARVQSMLEDVATVERSLKGINEMSGKTDPQSQNQVVRWIMNKETHAQKIIETISDYFLTQRVKAAEKDYAARLIKHHTVIVAAMKVKQNADMATVASLKESIEALLPYYPEHKH